MLDSALEPTRVQISALPLMSSVTLDKLLNRSVPQFLYLKMGTIQYLSFHIFW